MNNNINFLSITTGQREKKKKGVWIVRIIAVSSLILVSLLSVLSFYLNRNIYPQSLKHKYDSLLQSISVLHNKEAKLAIIENRIENITELLGRRAQGNTEREDYAKTIGKFTQKLPAGVTVESLKADKKTIILSLSSSSLRPINELIDNLIGLGQDKTISVMLLDSLSLNEATGTYSLSLTANL